MANVSSRQFYETEPDNGYLRGFVISINPGWSPLNLALQPADGGGVNSTSTIQALALRCEEGIWERRRGLG